MRRDEMTAGGVTASLTSKDFALFLVALLHGAGDDLHENHEPSSRVAGPSPDPANRRPARD